MYSGWANCRKLIRSDSGNIALMFGLAAVPLLLMLGGAVDFARYNRYKSDLANAVDAGALALARNAELYAEECKKLGEVCPEAGVFVGDYVATLVRADGAFDVGTSPSPERRTASPSPRTERCKRRSFRSGACCSTGAVSTRWMSTSDRA
jgi:hypothetical protein